jgi:CubicO group peptidase (beta-lactamase class C family)
MKGLGLGIVLVVCIFAVLSQGKNGKDIHLPDTVQGKIVTGFFDAFNSTDEELLVEFLQNNMRSDTGETGLIERRAASLQRFKKMAISLDFKETLSIADTKIRVIAQDSNENYYEMVFSFREDGADKIKSISIIPAELENLNELSGPLLSEKQVIDKVKSYLKEADRKDYFSGVVLVAKGDRVLFQHAYGLASREYDVPNQIDTRFNLGSINKIFTRIAIGQLYERDMLSLDDTLGKFLPDYPNKEAHKVTISQLLDMTSGIGDFFTEKYFEMPKYKIRNLEDYLPLFQEDSLEFEPGTGRVYSNAGYLILGLIVAETSGMNYFDYVRRNIYEPADMLSTGHLNADFIVKNVATGYTQNVAEVVHDVDGESTQELYNNMYTRPARGSSAGGGYSTAEDLFRFAQALRKGTLLGDLRDEWFKGAMAYAGGAPGINAEIDIDIVPGWTVVVLANADPPMANSVAQKIAIWLRRMK